MSPKPVVLTLIAFLVLTSLASLVYFMDRYEAPVTREQAVSHDMIHITKLMELYKLKHGVFPTINQGLRVLTEVREERHRKIEILFLDPWGKDYMYSLYRFNEQDCYHIWSEKLGKVVGYNSCQHSKK